MKIEEIKRILKDGEEIEFKYNDKNFSITFFDENNKTKISFCEFYKEPIDVDSIEAVFDIVYNGETVKDILKQIDKKDIVVYWLGKIVYKEARKSKRCIRVNC